MKLKHVTVFPAFILVASLMLGALIIFGGAGLGLAQEAGLVHMASGVQPSPRAPFYIDAIPMAPVDQGPVFNIVPTDVPTEAPTPCPAYYCRSDKASLKSGEFIVRVTDDADQSLPGGKMVVRSKGGEQIIFLGDDQGVIQAHLADGHYQAFFVAAQGCTHSEFPYDLEVEKRVVSFTSTDPTKLKVTTYPNSGEFIFWYHAARCLLALLPTTVL